MKNGIAQLRLTVQLIAFISNDVMLYGGCRGGATLILDCEGVSRMLYLELLTVNVNGGTPLNGVTEISVH